MDLFQCEPSDPVVIVELPESGDLHMFRDTAHNVIEAYMLAADDSPSYISWCVERSRDCDDPRTAVEFMTEDLAMWLVLDPNSDAATSYLF